MRDVTLVYLVRDGAVLLALKKRKFGEAKLNGYGGKPEPEDRDILDAAIRELYQESDGVRAERHDLDKRAEIEFSFPDVPEDKGFDQRVHVYLLKRWSGEPHQTEEMGVPEWYSRHSLPFYTMWVADPYWLPRVLDGEMLKGKVIFRGKGEAVRDYAFQVVKSF
jgi:8-oxo-dGTP pyrophosphatase MutT (NUDIX family)